MSSGPRFRFAPSPTGFFHVGGARTALYNWALAKRLGGTFVLRIEDTDEARNRPEWTQGIIDALAWIGDHRRRPRVRRPVLPERLRRCAPRRCASDCSRPAPRTTATSHRSRSRSAPRPAAPAATTATRATAGLGPAPGRVLRFRVPDGATTVHDLVRGDVVFEHSTIEDFVLLRGNGTPMFLLANVVDDIEMRISHVVRAEEHLPNTPKQQMLWEALGQQPPVWAHVPLLVNEQRKKLSKRRDKVAVEQYRAEGYLADAMVNYLMTLGWSPPGDQEIVPWSAIERDVPAGGRQPLAGVLRREEAHRVQRRVHPHAVRRGVHRRVPAVPRSPTTCRGRPSGSTRPSSPRWRRWCSRVRRRCRRCPASSTSCSSPTP